MSVLFRTFHNFVSSISEIVFTQAKPMPDNTMDLVELEQTNVSIDKEYNDMLQLKPSYNFRPRKPVNYKPLTL